MATTSLSLGEHWEIFIKNEIASGRYGSASEVVRDALRGMEERKSKLEALRVYLKEGAEQAERGEFVKDYSIDKIIEELDAKERHSPSKLLHVHNKTSKILGVIRYKNGVKRNEIAICAILTDVSGG